MVAHSSYNGSFPPYYQARITPDQLVDSTREDIHPPTLPDSITCNTTILTTHDIYLNQLRLYNKTT